MNAFDERELGLYCESRGLIYWIEPQFDFIRFKKKPYTGKDMSRILEECFEVEENQQTYTYNLSLFRRLTGSQVIRMLEDTVNGLH